MINNREINIGMIIHVAKKLGDLKKKVVFIGGCSVGLFITDNAMPEVRVTQDVDVIVEVASRIQYYKLEEQLQHKGFKQDMTEGAPLCRWLIDSIKVDFMPTLENILGFYNRWYLPAIRSAEDVELENGLTIRLALPPYFLATKIEAFMGRGNSDFMASHDMEDIIAVLDGRPEIISEIQKSTEDLKKFLADTFRVFLAKDEFRDALAGHLLPDHASQARLPLLIKRMVEISQIKSSL